MLTVGIGFILGLVLGSWVLCMASRSVTGEKFWGRSYCPHCKKQLRWYDLFPVLSYLSTLGNCRYCKKKIGLEYILFEIFFGCLVALQFLQTFGLNDSNTLTFLLTSNIYKIAFTVIELSFKILIISVLLAVFITDIKSGLIPDKITYPAMAISLLFLIILVSIHIIGLYQALGESALGKYLLPPHSDYFIRHANNAALPLWRGLLSALGLGLFFAGLIIVTRGRGMGGGDFKLAIFMGLVFGFPNSILAIMLSFLLGSIFSIVLIIFGKKKFGQTIPFGPFMSLGGLITLFWGNQIIDWYLQLNFFS